jgi:hypothetical protein
LETLDLVVLKWHLVTESQGDAGQGLFHARLEVIDAKGRHG